MIYLVGGPPKCGKTTLAKLLSKSAGIPWVSADTLQNVIKPYIDEEDFVDKFPLSAMRYPTNDEKYTENSAVEIISAYRRQAKTIYGAIEAFIASEVIDGNDYVVEGYQVEPELMARLSLEYPEDVRSVVIVKKDTEGFLRDIRKSTTPNDWILSKTKDESTFPKIVTMIAKYGSELEDSASKHDVKVFCLDEDFDSQLEAAAKFLTSPA